MPAATVDVIIPTASWLERPRLLIEDLSRELGQHHERVNNIWVADGTSVHQVKGHILGDNEEVVFEAVGSQNGPAINRNKAIRLATADWVMFLDDDVRLDQGWGTQLFEVLDRSELPDLMGGVIAAKNGRNWFSQAAEDFVIRHKLQPDGWYLAAAHLLVRRSALETLDGFDENFIYGGEDWDLCKRAHMHGLAIEVEESLRVFHEHPVTWSQLMKKADQYGPAEKGMDVYVAPRAELDEQRDGAVSQSPNARACLIFRALWWPYGSYREFRDMGRNPIRSFRSTLLYMPWMYRYLRSRRGK